MSPWGSWIHSFEQFIKEAFVESESEPAISILHDIGASVFNPVQRVLPLFDETFLDGDTFIWVCEMSFLSYALWQCLFEVWFGYRAVNKLLYWISLILGTDIGEKQVLPTFVVTDHSVVSEYFGPVVHPAYVVPSAQSQKAEPPELLSRFLVNRVRVNQACLLKFHWL